MGMPVFPPPMFPMPPPGHGPVPMPMAVEFTTPSVAIPLPVAVPLPVQIAVPAQPPPMFCQGSPRPIECSPCPPCVCTPSCTPAFFSYCSPCHQKCRCRNEADVPIPLPLYPPEPVQGPAYPIPVPGPAFPMPVPGPAFPMPVPAPGYPMPLRPPQPLIMYPYAPTRQRPPLRPIRRPLPDSSDSNCDSSSSPNWHRKRFGRRGRRMRVKRRNIGDTDFSDGEFVKPVLTYVSRNGNIKIKKKISNDDAEQLLDEYGIDNGRRSGEYEILTGGRPKPDSLMVSAAENDILSGKKKTYVTIGRGQTSHFLEGGKKELIFRPPIDKKITNLSVSFHVE